MHACTDTRICMHPCMHAVLVCFSRAFRSKTPTCMHARMHAWKDSWIACMYACMHACTDACIDACKPQHACMHEKTLEVHACMHAFLHACMLGCIWDVLLFACSLSQRDCERIAEGLSSLGISASFYHAKLDADTREKVQRSWMQNQYKVCMHACISFIKRVLFYFVLSPYCLILLVSPFVLSVSFLLSQIFFVVVLLFFILYSLFIYLFIYLFIFRL